MNPWKVRVSVIALILLLAIYAAGQYDFHRVVDGRKPLFARFVTKLNGGGSTRYSFLGYSITKTVRPKPGAENTLILAGPVLDYWIPGLGKEAMKEMPKPDFRAILNPKPISL